jgi:uncharacterized membrane protein (Fun14 family)
MSQAPAPPSPAGGARKEKREFPRWKKVLLTASVFLTVLGLGLTGYQYLRGSGADSDPQAAASRKNLGLGLRESPGIGQSFAPSIEGISRPGEGSDLPPDQLAQWSPAILKGGMSLLVGFCVGYALRTFAKVSAIVAGLVFVAIFALSYAGMLDVKWDVMDKVFRSVVASLQTELTNFKTFMTGSLPSAGMAGVGLFTGFKKS